MCKVGVKVLDFDEVIVYEEVIYWKCIVIYYFGLFVGVMVGFGGLLKEDLIVFGFGIYWLYDNCNMLLDVIVVFGFGDLIFVIFGLDLVVFVLDLVYR